MPITWPSIRFFPHFSASKKAKKFQYTYGRGWWSYALVTGSIEQNIGLLVTGNTQGNIILINETNHPLLIRILSGSLRIFRSSLIDQQFFGL